MLTISVENYNGITWHVRQENKREKKGLYFYFYFYSYSFLYFYLKMEKIYKNKTR